MDMCENRGPAQTMVRAKVIVAVCTYRRNGPLTSLLEAVTQCAALILPQAAVGVVVVDDSPDKTAETVARAFEQRFELGLRYEVSASGNISTARNTALESAMRLGDWIAMTDDDCEPVERWLSFLLEVQANTDADVVTGLMIRRPAARAADWVENQGFLQLGEFDAQDGQELDVAFTNNCLIRCEQLRAFPQLRFDEAMGRLGGEDMVFFAAARASGLRIRFSRGAIVFENEPADRLTFRYQLRRYFWHGNSSYVTLRRNGVGPMRMIVHGGQSFLRGLTYSASRVVRGKPPHFRFGLALLADATGKLLGSLGYRANHH